MNVYSQKIEEKIFFFGSIPDKFPLRVVWKSLFWNTKIQISPQPLGQMYKSKSILKSSH